jgi:hypothetical protein
MLPDSDKTASDKTGAIQFLYRLSVKEVGSLYCPPVFFKERQVNS